MKRLIGFLLLSISVFSTVVASPADPTMRKVIQPNGDSIMIVQCGDEYGFWYETLNGCVVEKNATYCW